MSLLEHLVEAVLEPGHGVVREILRLPFDDLRLFVPLAVLVRIADNSARR